MTPTLHLLPHERLALARAGAQVDRIITVERVEALLRAMSRGGKAGAAA